MRHFIDLYHFKSEIALRKSVHVMIESDFFYQNSEVVGTLLINELKIRINNISIATNKVEIYKINDEFHLTNVDDNVKVILY
ncbi:hypothetical protein P7D05_28340 [Bacillus paranthracis]|uniref:hypothetical protein n=1 Tax=Bacillus paranthracis TaxID=2026186 RepID=UPI00240D7EFC|nr:hypothetical protein [Bacillus paranthracis]MDG1606632.1 hypothetical protein [Bacillus paranthracis]